MYKIIENADHDAWLKARMYGIGGSDASAIVGMNPYKSNIDLFEEKTGRSIPRDICRHWQSCVGQAGCLD